MVIYILHAHDEFLLPSIVHEIDQLYVAFVFVYEANWVDFPLFYLFYDRRIHMFELIKFARGMPMRQRHSQQQLLLTGCTSNVSTFSCARFTTGRFRIHCYIPINIWNILWIVGAFTSKSQLFHFLRFLFQCWLISYQNRKRFIHNQRMFYSNFANVDKWMIISRRSCHAVHRTRQNCRTSLFKMMMEKFACEIARVHSNRIITGGGIY